MTNNQTIFMESQKLAKEGKIAYTGRVILFNVGGVDMEYKETEAIHTFLDWKNAGYMVKKGEKAIAKFAIWNYTEKASKAKKEAMEKAGDDPDKKMPHYYMKEAAFFSQSQVKKLDDKNVKADPVPETVPDVKAITASIPVKKSDLAILKRIVKDTKGNPVSRIVIDGVEYIGSSYRMVCDTENKYDDIPVSEGSFRPDTLFNQTAEAAKDGYRFTINPDALKLLKKENTGRKSHEKKPFIIKIVDGKKVRYAGFNPSFLMDVLTFTRTNDVTIAKDGFNKNGNLTSPAYIENGSRKAIVLPISLNPKTRTIDLSDVRMTVTI